MQAPLTTKQADLLDFIRIWMAEHRGAAPTRREIGRNWAGGKSVGNVQAHLKRLHAKGYIIVHPGQKQGITVRA